MAKRTRHSCKTSSKKAGVKKRWFHGKCRTRKQRTAYKRAHRHHKR